MTAQKTHVGFNKKGELTSGKCEADKRACPYGNHFADPSEAHNYLEEVSEAFQGLPPELVEGYKIHAEVMGESKIPFDEAVEMGFPEDIAHLLAGEPTTRSTHVRTSERTLSLLRNLPLRLSLMG